MDGSFDENKTSLVISNHIGILDPLFLASKLNVCFAAKAEMESWFLVGRICKSVGTIFVRRDRKLAASEFVTDIKERMDGGVNVLVFPEGTTSPGNNLKPFKTSSFEAVTSLPETFVQPTLIRVSHVNDNSSFQSRTILTWADQNQDMFSNFWMILGINNASVSISLGDPVPIADNNRKQLAESVHLEMTRLMDRIPASDAA